MEWILFGIIVLIAFIWNHSIQDKSLEVLTPVAQAGDIVGYAAGGMKWGCLQIGGVVILLLIAGAMVGLMPMELYEISKQQGQGISSEIKKDVQRIIATPVPKATFTPTQKPLVKQIEQGDA